MRSGWLCGRFRPFLKISEMWEIIRTPSKGNGGGSYFTYPDLLGVFYFRRRWLGNGYIGAWGIGDSIERQQAKDRITILRSF